MNSKLLEVAIRNTPDPHDGLWMEVCAGTVYRRGLELLDGNGRKIHNKGRILTFWVYRPADITDEEAVDLEQAITAECEEAVRMARTARALQALADVEALHAKVTESGQLLKRLRSLGGQAGEVAEIAGKLIALWGGLSHV